MNNEAVVKNLLSHHGVKGMKWGVRRRNVGTPHEVVVSTKPGKIKTSGGEGHSPHKDAVDAAVLSQKLKKSGTHSLSNDDLQKLALRLNLEKNVKQAQVSSTHPARKFVANTLANVAKQAVTKAANDATTKQVGNLLKKK